MSTLDLVKEFQSLDRMTQDGSHVDSSLARGHGGKGEAADLSGILTVDHGDGDEEEGDDNDENLTVQDRHPAGTGAVKGSTTTTAAAAADPPGASVSHLDGGICGGITGSAFAQTIADGDRQCESVPGGTKDEAWDSDGERESGGHGDGNGTTAISDGVCLGRPVAVRGGEGETLQPNMSVEGSFASMKHDGGGCDNSSAGGNSIPNVSWPQRPAEEGSDWDGDAGDSSDDLDSSGRGRRQQPQSSSSSDGELRLPKSDAPGVCRANLVVSSGADPSSAALSPPATLSPAGLAPLEEEVEDTPKHACERKNVGCGCAESPTKREPSRWSAKEGRSSPVERSKTAAEGQGKKKGDARLREPKACDDDGLDDSRSCSHGGDDNGSDSGRGEAETQEMFAATVMEGGAGGEASTIEALRAELSTLREHVIRSERKREAQLLELGTRLEAQERRSRRTSSGCTTPAPGSATRALPAGERTRSVQADHGGADEAVETRSGPDTPSGSGTPQGVAVHNPFAGTGGGAGTTPRDHFPAFEDALLEGGDEDGVAAAPGSREGERGVALQDGREGNEGRDKDIYSVGQNEAFDFSIDTLSHINNHTDFGTDATPASTTVPPAATMATSPKIGLDGRAGRGPREKEQLLWGMVESPATGLSRRLKGMGGGIAEEIFDARDRAAEEAFFSDACATASLQTPVKHMLANAVSGLGSAVCRGTPRGSSSTSARRGNSAAVASSFLGELRGQKTGSGDPVCRPPNGCESLHPCEDPASSPSDSQSPGLCMADVFARASAELEGNDNGGDDDHDNEDKVDDGDGDEKRGRSLPLTVSSSTAALGMCDGGASPAGAGAVAVAGTVATEGGRNRPMGVDVGCQTTWSFTAHDEIRFVSIPARVQQGLPLSSTRMADGRSCQKRTDISLESGDNIGCHSEGNLDEDSVLWAGPDSAACTPRDGRASCFTPRQSGVLMCKTPRRYPKRKSDDPPAGMAKELASKASSFFNSPNLSPIAVAPNQREGSVTSGRPSIAGVLDAGGTHLGASEDWREGVENRTSDEGAPRITSSRARRGGDNDVGQGLSPIVSEEGCDGSSTGGSVGGGRAFVQKARGRGPVGSDGARRNNGGAETTTTSDGGGVAHDRKNRTDASGHGNPRHPSGVSLATRSTTGSLNCSSGSVPVFTEPSADITRSSVLRASSTLETIAPLDDTGTTSLSCNSRAGTSVSFAGDLDADSKLRISAEQTSRYNIAQAGGAVVSPREEQPRHIHGDRDCDADPGDPGDSVLPPPFRKKQSPPQERRLKSVPPMACEWSFQSSRRSEEEGRTAGVTPQASSSSSSSSSSDRPGGVPGGVPPAVLGACLATAIHGSSRNDAIGGGGGGHAGEGNGRRIDGDQPVGARKTQVGGGRDDLLVSIASTAMTGADRLTGAGQAPSAQIHQISAISAPEYAAGPGDSPDSPPPPPPPLEAPLTGENDDGVNEEEIFYQRQRLLQRVVSAAAGHGGMMPSLPSLREVCKDEDERGRGEQGENQEKAGKNPSKRGDTWRRRSESLSWKTPSVTAAAARTFIEAGATEVGGTGDPPVGGGWHGNGTPAAYMRRHTSGYWRDRLGMTTH